MRVKFENGGIAVYYDIISSQPDQLYDFFLYGSHDNYKTPLKQVKGDVGQNLKTGTNKIIHWDARKEFGNFKGDINLKVKGGIHTPLLIFNNFDSNQKIKKTNPLNITWTSSSHATQLTMEVINNTYTTGYNIPIDNNGSYTWIVPKEFKTGKGYHVKISDRENPLVYEVSNEFSISRKVPVIVKVAPVILAGGAYLFLSGGSEKPSGSDNGNNDAIPNPPANP